MISHPAHIHRFCFSLFILQSVALPPLFFVQFPCFHFSSIKKIYIHSKSKRLQGYLIAPRLLLRSPKDMNHLSFTNVCGLNSNRDFFPTETQISNQKINFYARATSFSPTSVLYGGVCAYVRTDVA